MSTGSNPGADASSAAGGMDAATLAGIISAALALVRLFVSVFLAYYQYFTNETLNAVGIKSCNESVMGPLADTPTTFVDGSERSLLETRTLEGRSRDSTRTIVNERASWVTLLVMLQYMENLSATWQSSRIGSHRPQSPEIESHSLAVGVQARW